MNQRQGSTNINPDPRLDPTQQRRVLRPVEQVNTSQTQGNGSWRSPVTGVSQEQDNNSATGRNGPVTRGGYGNTLAVKRRGFIITVTSPKGGVGKSSLSLNLASYLGLRMQAEGKNVCILDANFQQADTGKYLNVYNPNITSIVRDPSSISRERLGQFLVHRPDLGISALLGPATPMDANPVYINSKLYNQVIEPLKEMYDYIVIDTPVAEKYHDILSSFALPQADYIVVPVTPNWAALMNADSWLNAVCTPRHSGGDGVDERKVGIVLNRAKATVDCSEEDVRQELSRWNFIGLIPENDAWQRCDNNGELIATQRFTDINDAFSRILYAATKEKTLLGEVYVKQDVKASKGSLFKKILKRGG